MTTGISLQSIRLKDVGVYNELELPDLDSQGLVTICGRNNDSHNVKNNSNGVGKSLMFGTLPNLLYEADPLALGKKEKKNMLAKGSEIDIEWKSPYGGKIRVVQSATKYKIYYNGEDQKVVRQDVARSWITKHFPLSADEFYSYCYVQSQIPHPFQRAKPADRLKYMTDLFKLDEFDRIRAAAKKKLDAAKDAETESKGLADMLDINQRKQQALKVTPVQRALLQQLIAKCEKLKDKRTAMYEQFVKLSTERNNAKQYEYTASKISELNVQCNDIKAELKTLRKQLQQHADYSEYVEELEEYDQRKKKLVKQIAALDTGDDVDTKKLVKKHSSLVKEEEELEQTLEQVDEQQAAYDEWRETCDKLGKRLSKLKSPKRTQEEAQDDRAESKAIVQAYRALQEHDHDGNSCPTCGQDVDIKAMSRAATKAQSIIDECIEAIDYHKLDAQLAALKDQKVKKPKHNRKELGKQLKAVVAKIEQIAEEFEQAKHLDKLRTQLESLERPEKVKKPKQARKEIKNRIEDLEALSSLRSTLKAYDVPRASFKKLNKQYLEMDEEIKTLTDTIQKKDLKAQHIKSVVQEHDHYESTIKDLTKRLDKLQPLIESRQVFEVLYKAYGSTALKLKAIEGRLKSIENKLNEYSSLVFPEPMRFELGTNASGVTATVTRTISGKVTDLSIMSGAETNCFRLLFALAIIPFIPANRRTDFIVLDEPDNSCSPATREYIISNFLPIIQQIIPNIYWITPLDVEHFSHNQWTVTKENGQSELTKKLVA